VKNSSFILLLIEARLRDMKMCCCMFFSVELVIPIMLIAWPRWYGNLRHSVLYGKGYKRSSQTTGIFAFPALALEHFWSV